MIAEDREHAVARGDTLELRDPRLEVGDRRVDDVAGHAYQVRLQGGDAVERLAERCAVGERSQVEVAQVNDAKAGERSGQASDRHVEPRDGQPTVAPHVAVGDRRHRQRDQRQRDHLEAGRQRERVAAAGDHAGLGRQTAEADQRDPETREDEEDAGAGGGGEPAGHDDPCRAVDDCRQPRLALEDACREPVEHRQRGQHEELGSRREGAKRGHEPAGEDPLADGPGDRETREEPAKQQLIEHPSADTHAKPAHRSAFSAGHGDAHRLTIPKRPRTWKMWRF